MKTTLDSEEASKFAGLADQWWEPYGKFKILHDINNLRLSFIYSQIDQQERADTIRSQGISVLDVGCGGGILCISMAKKGFIVTGIDPVAANISSAMAYAEKNNVSNVSYFSETIEQFSMRKEKFDVVISLEVIEHVSNVHLFIQHLDTVLKPNGKLFISTINRNIKSYLYAIIGAEYVLRWLPRGTHSWNKFIKPSELNAYLNKTMNMVSIAGMHFNPLNRSWILNQDPSVNYITAFQKLQADDK